MRVISGKYGGRVLKFPKSKDIRPLSDLAKEGLFQILDVNDKSVLDIYAGSGQLGIEALSRGADKVTFVEKDKNAIKIISENLRSVGIKENTKIYFGTDEKYLRTNSEYFNLIIANPPFAKINPKIIEQLFSSLSEDGILVFIHSPRDIFEFLFPITDSRTYGDNQVDFFKKK